jgi:hypothetical protein
MGASHSEATPEVTELQVQDANYSIELSTNTSTFFVGETITFEGHLVPGQVAEILLTVTITDGSQETRVLSSNGTGDFEYEWYLSSAGPYSASAQLIDPTINSSASSNVVSFIASYPPTQSTTSQTSQQSTTAQASTFSSTPATTGAAPAAKSPDWQTLLLALTIVIILAVLTAVWRIKRKQGPGLV